MDTQPPASPDCPHPAGQVDHAPTVNFQPGREAWHCRACGRYWLSAGGGMEEVTPGPSEASRREDANRPWWAAPKAPY